MNNSYFREHRNVFFGLKILKFFDAGADPESGIFLTLDPMENLDPGCLSRICNTVPDNQKTGRHTKKRASNLPAQQSQGRIPRKQVRRQGQAPHVCRRQAATRRKKGGGGGRRTQRRKCGGKLLLRRIEQRRPGKASQARRQRRRLFGKQAERSRQPRVGVGHRWQGGGEGEGVAAAAAAVIAVVPLRNTQG
jgi:hypothetical protein